MSKGTKGETNIKLEAWSDAVTETREETNWGEINIKPKKWARL